MVKFTTHTNVILISSHNFLNVNTSPDAYVGKAEIHLEAKNYIKARENYEEAIHNTYDEKRITELHAAYHRTYFVPVYTDSRRQVEPDDELFRKARLLRMEGQYLEAAEIYERLANSNIATDDAIYTLYWMGRCYHEAALQNPASTSVTSFRKSVDAFERLILDYEDNSYTIKTYHYLTLAYSDSGRSTRRSIQMSLGNRHS